MKEREGGRYSRRERGGGTGAEKSGGGSEKMDVKNERRGKETAGWDEKLRKEKRTSVCEREREADRKVKQRNKEQGSRLSRRERMRKEEK